MSVIHLPGVENARDLGGYTIGDKAVKPGVLLRTARLDQAGPEALLRLQQEYRVQTVVDFRMTEEQQARPDPAIPGAVNLRLSVMDLKDVSMPGDGSPEEALAASREMIALYTDPAADRVALLDRIGELVTPDLYVGFLLTERGKAAYRAFFQALLRLDEGRALLWHCTDGKDRTGCAAMLLLFALGASRETVLEDYMLTNEVNAAKLAALREKVAPCQLGEEKLGLLLFISGGVNERFMNRAIDALIDRYGSVDGYLERELGLGPTELDALRRRFLTA